MKTMQNLVSLVLSAEQLTAIEQAAAVLEANLTGLISLSGEQKQQMVKTGEKSEMFCLKVLSLMAQNTEVLPANVKPEDALADQRAREQLRPILQRLGKLVQRLFDTELALGSDVMAAALHGYKMLKANGRGYGLETLQRDVGGRFAKKRLALDGTPPEVTGSA